MKYAKHFSTVATPQTEAIPGRESEMVQNAAGGVSFQVDKWTHLNRFFILGSEGGTYYTSEKKLTKKNAHNLLDCIKEDGLRVVNEIVTLRRENRAPKMDPLLFALAACSKLGDEKTRVAANSAVSEVCGIPTHLFAFLEAVKAFGKWSSGTNRAIKQWYENKPVDNLAYQVVKYRNREGWAHKDALRVGHPKKHSALFDWIAHDKVSPELPAIVPAFLEAQATTDVSTIVKLIGDHNLPRECIPTELLGNTDIWEALLPGMPITATIRNLGKMSSIGLLTPMGEHAKTVVARLTNEDLIRKGRVHPIQILSALITYKNGQGTRGSLTWDTNPQILEALNDAFYLAFNTIEPTGKNFLLGIDVSSSMTWGEIAGVPGLTPNIGAAVMAMVTARTEQNYYIHGFTDQFRDLGVTAKDSLESAMNKTQQGSFGSTNCALPMEYALKKGIEVDTFVVYTDNETYAGRNGHPSQALRRYRDKMGRNSKLIVVGFTATECSIADPKDPSMLDIAGFDSSCPSLIAEFSK